MIDPEPEKPRRRVRYRGKNPRRFHEKYKEHQPGRYPEQVARVMARGQTPVGSHRPIMVREILDVLLPRPGAVAVDCTLGYGGHARERSNEASHPASNRAAESPSSHSIPAKTAA